MNVNEYIDYFRQLAVRHKDLLHDPASETGDAPFQSQHFTKISTEEILASLRSKVGWPLMALELYETDTEAEIEYDVRQKAIGAFSVVDHPAKSGLSAEEACYAKAELIVIDLLKQIWQDHYGLGVDRCNTPFKEFSFDSIEIIPIGPVFDKEFGYRVTFKFRFQNTIDFTEAPAPGTFDDPIPEDLEDILQYSDNDFLLYD